MSTFVIHFSLSVLCSTCFLYHHELNTFFSLLFFFFSSSLCFAYFLLQCGFPAAVLLTLGVWLEGFSGSDLHPGLPGETCQPVRSALRHPFNHVLLRFCAHYASKKKKAQTERQHWGIWISASTQNRETLVKISAVIMQVFPHCCAHNLIKKNILPRCTNTLQEWSRSQTPFSHLRRKLGKYFLSEPANLPVDVSLGRTN